MLNKTAIALGIALALGAASSASAANLNDWDPWVGAPQVGYSYGNRGVDAFAQAPSAGFVDRNGVSAPAVYENGKIVGHDPDPNVRQQLVEDYPFVTN